MADFDGGRPLGGYLVGVKRSETTLREAEDHLEELAQLAKTYGIPANGSELIQIRVPVATYLAGPGQVEGIARHAKGAGADVIILDDELSPSQQRNWERTTELAVIDRREVILGISADRAQTREARLQVQLARAEYSLPRLTRAWTHLERQRGGGGFRGGAGEAQLEVDRRLLADQIGRLKRELKHVRQVRATQRKQRLSVPLPTAARDHQSANAAHLAADGAAVCRPQAGFTAAWLTEFLDAMAADAPRRQAMRAAALALAAPDAAERLADLVEKQRSEA